MPLQISDKLDFRFKALSSEFRRFLMGLIYTEGPIYQSLILKHVMVSPSRLSYNLKLLAEARLIERLHETDSSERNPKYSITEDGKKFFKAINISRKLDESVTVVDSLDAKVTRRRAKTIELE